MAKKDPITAPDGAITAQEIPAQEIPEQGGSYIRQPSGELTLQARTQASALPNSPVEADVNA
jgi:hypothetical protein